MNKIKKGDIVGRISYGKDIAFVVDRIIKTNNNKKIAILKGLTLRVQADSDLEDLELMETKQIKHHVRLLEEKLSKRIQKCIDEKKIDENHIVRGRIITYTGKILHIDGDRRYSEKSNRYYKKIGLNAIVKNVPERKQQFVVGTLLNRYKPDILIVTGHDGMISKGTKFNDLYNYRNSKYFVKTVEEARKINLKKDLVIFARCMSKLL